MIPDIAEIEDTLSFLDSWEDRFEYVIDLGKQLPALQEGEQVDAHRVHGCQSSVWLVVTPAAGGHLEVRATSDAFIVCGLIAVLMSASRGMTARQLLAFDFESLFKRIGLSEHISPTRRNGLHAMIERIKLLAAAHASGEGLA